jgi:hypothetical protein
MTVKQTQGEFEYKPGVKTHGEGESSRQRETLIKRDQWCNPVPVPLANLASPKATTRKKEGLGSV